MLYIVPLTVSVSPSLVHVTVVAGEPVEVQVRVRVSGSYVRLDTVGRAEGMNNAVYHEELRKKVNNSTHFVQVSMDGTYILH